jgi:hypothetical protein
VTLAAAEPDSGEQLRLAARHLARAENSHRLREVFRLYVRVRRRSGDQRRASVLARELCPPDVPPAALHQMVRALPIRFRITRPLVTATVAVFAVTALVAGYVWLSTPVRLEIAQRPIFGLDLEGRRPAIVEVVDRSGRRVARYDDSVEIRIDPASDFTLTGATRVPAPNGRAVFDSVLFAIKPGIEFSRGPVSLSIGSGQLQGVELDSIVIGTGANNVSLDSARIKGRLVTPASPRIEVAAGDSILGTVWLRYTSSVGRASVLCTIVPNWGDRTQHFIVGSDMAPVAYRDTMTLRLNLRAPLESGRYWVAFVANMETEARFIASGTNWALLHPRWNDGNDVVDLDEERVHEMIRNGGTMWPWDLLTPADPVSQALHANELLPDVPTNERQVSRDLRWLPGTAIEVVVR